ncbi:hypothetical protein N8W01_23870, partial [Enterobacter roggenkampii]|nr:hypothetical protein [Enterobacter roggenkampii]
MPAFEWVHVQLHQQKGMISLSPPTICNSAQSGATIYRLYGKPNAPELFLKHGKGSVANDVTDEMVRLNWLTAFMPLPTIKHFIRT